MSVLKKIDLIYYFIMICILIIIIFVDVNNYIFVQKNIEINQNNLKIITNIESNYLIVNKMKNKINKNSDLYWFVENCSNDIEKLLSKINSKINYRIILEITNETSSFDCNFPNYIITKYNFNPDLNNYDKTYENDINFVNLGYNISGVDMFNSSIEFYDKKLNYFIKEMSIVVEGGNHD